MVDIGGGVGSVSLNILKAYPKLKFVVQDLPSVIESANKVSTVLVDWLFFIDTDASTGMLTCRRLSSLAKSSSKVGQIALLPRLLTRIQPMTSLLLSLNQNPPYS